MKIVTPEKVKGLWGHKASLTKTSMYVEGIGSGCERLYGSCCGGKTFIFGSNNPLTRRFAERMLQIISKEKDRLWNAPVSVFVKKNTHEEISRLEKAYKRYRQIAGSEEPDGWFVPASKEEYEHYKHLHDKPYPQNAVMGTIYTPDNDDTLRDNTPQEVFSLCLLLRRLQRH
jgi:hypothetical protein